jgi:uncharacterized membrane-anchored protein
MAGRRLLVKVPEITLWFWIVKILCTTVGETAADFLNISLNLGLTGTSVVTGLLLAVVLVLQFRADRYVAVRYWLAVTLVSVFGTLVTDNLTDNLGVPLEASTLLFGALLALTFLAWYRTERTLSVHSIDTRRREAFYWLAILFTFALGTATGDLMAEVLGLGYLATGTIVAAVIALTALAWWLGLHPVLGFWVVYVLTRPLGASIGDLLSQPGDLGGLGLGATVTSLVFLVAIIGIVTYLAVSKVDVIPAGAAPADETAPGGLWQTAVVLVVLLAAGGTGYALRTSALAQEAAVAAPAEPAPTQAAGAAPAAVASPLGDLSAFRTITQDTLTLLEAGDQSGATARVDALETSWDSAEARLKPRDKAAWTEIDGRIDAVLRQLRSTSPDPTREQAALTDLLTALS